MPQTTKQVAYCGLYCPKCYKNVVSEAAAKLKFAIENTHICNKPNVIPIDFKKTLDKLVELHCPVICKNGGGNPNCAIKKCCKEKDINGCWECGEYRKCDKLHERFVKNIGEIKKLGLMQFIKLNNQKTITNCLPLTKREYSAQGGGRELPERRKTSANSSVPR